MRLNQYLNENRSVSIGEKDAAEYIKEKCRKAWDSTRIYRGNERLDDKYYFIDPTKSYERISPFAEYNFYNLLLSNLPSWKKYPKRNKSVICTTSSENARHRGRDIYYFVLPVDGANIGICPDRDIWDCFNDSGVDLEDFGNHLDDFFETNNISVSDNDYNDFVDACKKIDKYKEEGSLDIYDSFSDWLIKFKKTDKTFLEYLNNLLNPNKNNFKLVTVGKKIGYDREVWTGDKCVLVRTEQTLIGSLLNSWQPIEELDKIK